MIAINIAIAALVVSTLGVLATVWNTVRAGQWRNTDDGKAVNTKIGTLNDRLTVIETKLVNMPTAADFERLVGKIDTANATSSANHQLLVITRNQLNRVEGFFMEDRS